MSQNISISVQDELYTKMQKWKESFNYSRLFQDVVSREIQKKEDFQIRLKGDASMEEVIERLKKEKEESGNEYFEQGKSEGLEWAKASHYDEIQRAVRFANEWQYGESAIGYLKWDDPYNEVWNEFWKDILEGDPGLEDDGHNTNNNMDRFIDGWTEGIKEFWNEVESKL